jgi:hypothetical protein
MPFTFILLPYASLSTLNSHLLLNSGEIINNNIFLCLAEDVLDFVSKNDISEENTIKIYYPFLYNKNITSLQELQGEKEKLIDSNKKVINDKTEDLSIYWNKILGYNYKINKCENTGLFSLIIDIFHLEEFK